MTVWVMLWPVECKEMVSDQQDGEGGVSVQFGFQQDVLHDVPKRQPGSFLDIFHFSFNVSTLYNSDLPVINQLIICFQFLRKLIYCVYINIDRFPFCFWWFI